MGANDGRLVLVSLAIAGLANAAAYAFDLFDRVFWVDKALHVYTSFAVTLALAYAWRDRLAAPLRGHPVTLTLTLAALGLALGVLWEIGEWIADLMNRGDIIRGKTDTIVDLIVDGAGALIAGWLAVHRGREAGSPRPAR